MECLPTETRVSLNFKHINKVIYWLVDGNVTRVSPTNSKQLDSAQVPQTFFFSYHHLMPELLLHPTLVPKIESFQPII